MELSKEEEGCVAFMGGNENQDALVPLHLTQAMMELSLKRKASQDVEAGMAVKKTRKEIIEVLQRLGRV